MPEQKWTSEPWDGSLTFNTEATVYQLPRDDYLRAEACVNACAPIKEDPAVALEAARETLKLWAKFVEDANYIPPWESAGKVWYEKMKPAVEATQPALKLLGAKL